MSENTTPTPLEPGVFQGTPEAADSKNVPAPRLIRTMKSDEADAIKKQNETTVSIAMAEEKKKSQKINSLGKDDPTTSEATPPAPKRIGRIVILAIIIALISTYIFIAPKLKNNSLPALSLPTFGKPSETTTASSTPLVLPIAPSIIPAQGEKRFDISKESSATVLSAIMNERQKELSVTSIKNFYFTEDSEADSLGISINRFLRFVGITAPETITRSLEKPFMVGLIGEQGGRATPFIMMKFSDNEVALAAMLEWESAIPHMFDVIFGSTVNTGLLATTKFYDVVISGKDARYSEVTPTITIAYAFANPTTLVIAESKSALETLLPLAVKK
ncbi:hypothetical protein AUJ77_01055 [Candidatus Nomurabacteria bacterium CG1_02_43_90]|uniref:Uncharacterized protein n=1 Tax=Candidatus Nomurabacteria bacterium CG1_02_43_90 TaxID=1805281 RepID=A0A1J4V4J8_9BACT|nr:MAG: hypothetical protein AUJ77_01055 [Candidatus Nomurabacteria bacterium CG1_02_43_90]